LQHGFERRRDRCVRRAWCRDGATVKTAVANELERAVNELQAALRAAAWLAEQ